jgi:hypothetical protein
MMQTKNMSDTIFFTTSNYCEFKIVSNVEGSPAGGNILPSAHSDWRKP